ncbi:MAG: hypothetical protein H7A49_16535 [Akkermansiaceae bacterium]|nr:hypothetical protein [Akkermansiaceae bacterium]MCP5548220.1 hypothetical protein [Akkermansiaceae bacterium]
MKFDFTRSDARLLIAILSPGLSLLFALVALRLPVGPNTIYGLLYLAFVPAAVGAVCGAAILFGSSSFGLKTAGVIFALANLIAMKLVAFFLMT